MRLGGELRLLHLDIGAHLPLAVGARQLVPAALAEDEERHQPCDSEFRLHAGAEPGAGLPVHRVDGQGSGEQVGPFGALVADLHRQVLAQEGRARDEDRGGVGGALEGVEADRPVMAAQAQLHGQLHEKVLHVRAVRIVAVGAFGPLCERVVFDRRLECQTLDGLVTAQAQRRRLFDEQFGMFGVVRIMTIGATFLGSDMAGLARQLGGGRGLHEQATPKR